jgi:hypothetical protein
VYIHDADCLKSLEEGDKIRQQPRDRLQANEAVLIGGITRREYDLVHSIDIAQG